MTGRAAPSDPASGSGANKACDGAAEPCPLCDVTSVQLVLSKNKLTLKHDRDCKLEVKVEPASVAVDSYKIEIKRASGGGWCTVSTKPKEDPWQAKIAGKFKLRAVIVACGKEHKSAEVDLEVQFPQYSEIAADADVVAATDREWNSTLVDCTGPPNNRRRERGFWVRLNTTSNQYEFTTTVQGSWRGPTQGASVPLPARPADSPASPSACDAGAVYSVASFHTHTPTTYRGATSPPGSVRPIGPSGADQRIDTRDDVPGLVYDYEESPAGSGSVPMGHPEAGAARLYHSRGKTRRTTPP